MKRSRCLALAAAVALHGCWLGPEKAPSVLLIVIDTLRVDRVSAYGYPRQTTPGLDAIAARGVRFENAYSTSSWTLPAHASMFTGLFPIEHGATQEHTELDDRAETLAEILAAHGYATFAASGNGVVNRGSGLVRGFETFVETWRDKGDRRSPLPEQHPNLLAVRQFLTELDSDERFFAFVNYVEVHGPYTPPEPYRSRFLPAGPRRSLVESAQRRKAAEFYLDPRSISKREFALLNDLYDGEVAYADALVTALIDAIDAAGRLADTLVIVTSDHGENIGDHGHFRHVFSLYNSAVRVPLIALLPGAARAGEVRAEPVSLVDLFATILAAAGVELDVAVNRGRNILDPGAVSEAAPVFAEYYFPLQALGLFALDARGVRPAQLRPHLRRMRSVERGGMRLIWSSDGRDELYDLERDPDELRDLSRDPDAAVALRELRALLADYVERGGGGRPLPEEAESAAPIGAFGDLDPETADQLRELGYLGDG